MVSLEEGNQLAEKYKLLYYEASAKTGENIEKLFMDLARSVKNKLFDLEKENPKNNDDKINITTLKTG